jgi:acyl-CoA hydrolase
MDHEKYFSAEEALSRIKKGSRVFVGSGCGEPQYLIEQLIALADKMFDVEILHVLSIRDPGYTATRLGDHFRIKTLKN